MRDLVPVAIEFCINEPAPLFALRGAESQPSYDRKKMHFANTTTSVSTMMPMNPKKPIPHHFVHPERPSVIRPPPIAVSLRYPPLSPAQPSPEAAIL